MSSNMKTCIIFNNEMTLHRKKISAVIKTFSVFLGFGLRFLIVLFQVAGWFMGFGGFFLYFTVSVCRRISKV